MVEIHAGKGGGATLGLNNVKAALNHRILAHRGLWSVPEEQNTLQSLSAALNLGFGIETDLRDLVGELVVSHDMPRGDEVRLPDLFDAIQDHPEGLPIALNIKSDGLAKEILRGISLSNPAFSNTFFFDMSVPQYIQYSQQGMPVAIRRSEYELVDPLISLLVKQRKQWVWLDAFNGDWWIEAGIIENPTHTYVIVSPELHGRPYSNAWQAIKTSMKEGADVYICTDFPVEFSRFLDAD
jgi:hypothetical protein